MTEAEWLACDHPARMLIYLRGEVSAQERSESRASLHGGAGILYPGPSPIVPAERFTCFVGACAARLRQPRRQVTTSAGLIGASTLLQVRPRHFLHESDGDAPIALRPDPDHLTSYNAGRQTLPVDDYRTTFDVRPFPCVMAL